MRTKLPMLGLLTAIALVATMSIGGPSFAAYPTWRTFSTAADGGTTINITPDGNVWFFESPSGAFHIDAEGYVLCYQTPSGYVGAYDTLTGTSGFALPTQGTSNVLRNTSDNVLSLNQAFTFSGTNKQLTIAMTVKNLTGSTVTGVVLRRQVDFNIDTVGNDDWHAATVDSYFAWGTHGMVLRHISQPSGVSHGAVVDTLGYASWCSPVGVSNPVQGDYGGTLGYDLGNLGPYKSKVIKVAYLRD